MRKLLDNRYFDQVVVRQQRRMYLLLAIGFFAIILVLILTLKYGSQTMSLKTIYSAIFHYNGNVQSHQIIHDIRMPRALVAILIGAFLAISGAVMQAITMNPLAEPSLLGVTSGAAFALVLANAFISGLTIFGSMFVAMIGAGFSVTLVFLFITVSKGGISQTKLILAGIATGMFLSSFTSVISLYFNMSKTLYFWYAGSLANMSYSHVRLLFIVAAIILPLLFFISKALTLLQLGEDSAKGLGVNLNFVRIVGIAVILCLTGVAVSIAGAIGFIGLVIPHISRILNCSNYAFTLPVTGVFGGGLLLLADLLSKLINPPYETPIGVVTAFIGVPFFLYLVRQLKGGGYAD